MWNRFKKLFKRQWKNIALVALAFHFIVDVTAYGNLGYTIYKFII